MASVSISCPSCSATDGVVRSGKALSRDNRANR
ncbi:MULTISPECIES: IS1 family transposase, partial [unclassified Providencia]